MEHYGSTLATTACAVFGLVAAAHILHPGNYEVRERPARTVAASAPSARTAWIDPPARSAPAPVALAGAERAALRVAMASPVEAAVPPLVGTMARTDRAADAARPAKAVRRAVRARPVARTAQADRAAKPDAAAAPRESGRIDPIGDLIRGLGIGGEG